MKVKLGVGLANGRDFGFTLLEQSGIPGFLISSVEEAISSGLRIIFWNGDPLSLRLAIKKYPEVQFALLTTHDFVGKFYGKSVGNHLSAKFSSDDNLPGQKNTFYLNQKIYSYPGADKGCAFTKNGDKIMDSGILILEDKNLILISFPWDFLNYRLGNDYAFRPYYSRITEKNFVEIGPAVDLEKYRKLVISKLIYASDRLELPLIATEHPFLNGKYFSVRIDADGFQKEAISEVLTVADQTGLRFTWFIDVNGWHGNFDTLKLLSEHRQTIQFHCYKHMTYRSAFLNKVNIKKGLRFMKKSHLEPDAIVSPNGFYPAGFARAINKFGFQYSSEFGYDVDNLPSWPENDQNQPLQLPVHPGSFGVFLNAGFTDSSVFKHLLQTVHDRASGDGLAILYEHPYYFQNRTTQWVKFYQELLDDGYQYISLSDIAKNWKDKMAGHVNLTYDLQSGKILPEELQVASQLVLLNNVKASLDNVYIREPEKMLYGYDFLVTDPDGVKKEIESRQWILEESKISVPEWFWELYLFNFKVLIIQSLKKLNLYKKFKSLLRDNE